MLKDGTTIGEGGIALTDVDTAPAAAGPNLHLVIDGGAPIAALGNLATAASEKIPVSHLGGTALGRRADRELSTPPVAAGDISAQLLDVQAKIGILEAQKYAIPLRERPALNDKLTALRDDEAKILIDYRQVAEGHSAYYRDIPDSSAMMAPLLPPEISRL